MILLVFFGTLFTVFMVQVIIQRIRKFRLRAELGLDGPPFDYFTGSIRTMYNYIKDNGVAASAQMSNEMHEKYGDTFGFYNGPTLDIASRNPEFAKEVMISQFGNFVDRQTMALNDTFPMIDGLLQISGRGQNGVGWKDVRSVVSPAFTSGKMKKMHHIMQERSAAFVNMLKAKVEKGEECMDIYEEWQSLTIDTIARSAFAVPCDSLNDRNDTFYVNSRKFFNVFTLENSPIPIFFSYLLPTVAPYIRRFTNIGASERPLIEKLQQVVRDRRAHFDSFEGTDLIQLLLEQDTERQKNEAKPPLSDNVIVSNCFHFLLAGYETTSTALAFATWCLATHPEIQEKLYAEIVDTFGDEQDIDYERVMKAPYLDCVFRETLRRLPPVVLFTSRTCIQDTTVTGIRIPAGCTVTIPVHCIHWSEKYWDKPMEFIPERFEDPETKKRVEWMPFGIGPRNCVGMRFAEMEFKTALAAAVRTFRIHPQKKEDLSIRLSLILLRPLKSVDVRLELRK